MTKRTSSHPQSFQAKLNETRGGLKKKKKGGTLKKGGDLRSPPTPLTNGSELNYQFGSRRFTKTKANDPQMNSSHPSETPHRFQPHYMDDGLKCLFDKFH